MRVSGHRLDSVRGAAHIALGDRETAMPYLWKALDAEPNGARAGLLKGWLAA